MAPTTIPPELTPIPPPMLLVVIPSLPWCSPSTRALPALPMSRGAPTSCPIHGMALIIMPPELTPIPPPMPQGATPSLL